MEQRQFQLTSSLQEYRTLRTIADHSWTIEHVDVNIEIGKALGGALVESKATLGGAVQMWSYLWQQMLRSWRKNTKSSNIPRLRSLDVVGGPIQELGRAAFQLRFQVDISERDDEARAGIARVKCVELEALESVIGPAGPYRNAQQERFMEFVRKAAEEDPRLLCYPMVYDRELLRTVPFWDRRDKRRFYYK